MTLKEIFKYKPNVCSKSKLQSLQENFIKIDYFDWYLLYYILLLCIPYRETDNYQIQIIRI